MNPGSLTTSSLTKRFVPLVRLLRVGLFLLAALPVPGQTEATIVPLISPTALAFDASGVLYLAETNRHVVDRLDKAGKLTVAAGDGIQGFAGEGGPATSARLDSPRGLAIDTAGNLYVADTHNHRIRKVDAASGTITTLAGTGSPGYSGDGAAATQARLTLPTALALDQAGSLFIADSGNQRIRKVNLATGTITTVAGNGIQGSAGDLGLATSASLDTPFGLAANAAGDLYLADLHNQRVRRVAHDTGVITTLASATTIRLPRGLSLDSAGNVYVAETGGHRILRLAPNGAVTPLAGTGAEGFFGDGGPATSALLDRPNAAAISPAGLLTLADTGNQRLRQVDAAGAIHTLSGLGGSTASTLSLAASPTVQYGTGTLIATLGAAPTASGSISLLEVSGGTTTLLGSAALSASSATFSAATLPAGPHHLLASYAGDAANPSLASNTLLLTVTPALVTALANPVTVLYGQALPPVTGTVSGLLPQDAGRVAAVFSTGATTLSPPGGYPILLTLSGSAAPNYQATVAPANVTVLQAPTLTTVASSPTGAVVGTPMTISAKAASTTQGVPTGTVTFLDAAAILGTAPADASGAASMPANLGVGTHSLTAVYSGDKNFLASTSPALTQVISPGSGSTPDFSVAPAGTISQTTLAGSTASFSFNVSVQNGPLNSPILLTAGGMPPGATASFNPAYLPPGGAVSAFTLSVQTTKTTASAASIAGKLPPIAWAFLIGSLVILPRKRRSHPHARWALLMAALCVAFASLVGCGDRVAPLPASATTSLVSYPLSVTATSTLPGGTTLQHTATVTLIVQ